MGPTRYTETSVNVNKSMKTSCALKMGPTNSPETSAKDYHSTLRNTPEERRNTYDLPPIQISHAQTH
jgi:hypothetical protein